MLLKCTYSGDNQIDNFRYWSSDTRCTNKPVRKIQSVGPATFETRYLSMQLRSIQSEKK